VTTALERTGQDGRLSQEGAQGPDAQPGIASRWRGSWFARDPAWPIAMLLIGWPLWWALGFAEYASAIFMIPMLHRMYLWRARRTRVIRMPRGFGLWLLFLVCMIASTVALSQTAPGTLPGPSSTRLISWAVRAASYLSATVVLLYAGNLTERELPRRRLAWMLGLVGLYAVIGGYLAVLDPHLHFTSPLSSLAPASIQASSGGEIYTMLHPGLTQLNTFQGRPRVSGPFLYTNAWSNNLAILLPWLLVAWRSRRTNRPSRAAVIVMVLALAPSFLSYDRGLWLAIALGLLYLAVRLARQGKIALLGGFIAATLVVGVVILASPLQTYISSRLNNGASNTARNSLTVVSIKEALSSPLIGYGDTRRAYGSSKSAAIGRTANCSRCGNRSAGSNGQLWLLLITTGFPGTIFFLAFFGYGAWQFRRDKTPYGMVGEFVLLIGFMFDLIYDAIGGTLIFTMLAFALLWRNERVLRGEEAPADLPEGEPVRMVTAANGSAKTANPWLAPPAARPRPS
jgi:hypothetical protein